MWKCENLDIMLLCSTLSLLVRFPRWLLSSLSISFTSSFYVFFFGARVGIKSMPSLFLLSIFSSRVISCTHLHPPPFQFISMGSGVIEMYNAWPLVYVHINLYTQRADSDWRCWPCSLWKYFLSLFAMIWCMMSVECVQNPYSAQSQEIEWVATVNCWEICFRQYGPESIRSSPTHVLCVLYHY